MDQLNDFGKMWSSTMNSSTMNSNNITSFPFMYDPFGSGIFGDVISYTLPLYNIAKGGSAIGIIGV